MVRLQKRLGKNGPRLEPSMPSAHVQEVLNVENLASPQPLRLAAEPHLFQVDQPHVEVSVDDEILRLQVAVADAQLDQRLPDSSYLPCHILKFVVRLRAKTNVPVQRFAFNVIA